MIKGDDMERPLCIEVDKKKVFSFKFSFGDRAVILSWVAGTEVPNIAWVRLITIKWQWPPVRCVECFADRT